MEAQEIVATLVERGFTQVQISERTGIAQPTLSKVLRGEVDDVLSRNYRKLDALLKECVAGDAAALDAQAAAG